MTKYFCYCGEEVSTLVTNWNRYTNAHSNRTRWLCIECRLLCLDHGTIRHEENKNHAKDRGIYRPSIQKVSLWGDTREQVVAQIRAQVLDNLKEFLTNYYLPATDLKRALSDTKKVKK